MIKQSTRMLDGSFFLLIKSKREKWSSRLRQNNRKSKIIHHFDIENKKERPSTNVRRARIPNKDNFRRGSRI